MRNPFLIATLTLLSVTAAACAPPPSDDPELILTGGMIYPLGGDDEPVEAIAIRGDWILALGDDQEILALAGDYTQQMELEESVVLPGSYDAWLDPEALGRWSDSALDLRLAASVEEVQAMVRNAAGATRPGQWIVGWGWSENDWPDPELPDRQDLDATGADAPIVLLRRSGDIAWLNSAALATLELPSAPTGRAGMLVEAPDGAPSGILIGRTLDALAGALSPDNDAQRREWIARGLREAAAAGITRVGTSPLDASAVAIFLDLESRGLLPVRVDVRLTPEAAVEIARSNLQSRIDDSLLVRLAAVGLRMDGSLGARSAAVDEPYEGGGAASHGVLLADGDKVAEAARVAAESGLPLHLHASGDRAINVALEAFAGELPPNTEIIGLDLPPDGALSGLARSAAGVGIAAARFADDIYWLDRILGADRARRAYPWADLAAAGIPLSFASDAPAYPLRPLLAVAAAVNRQDAAGYPADGWNPDQHLSLSSAVRALVGTGTSIPDPALRPDGLADLVVWSENPLQGGTQGLLRGQALLTIVAGRVAYSRPLVDVSGVSERSR